MQEPTRETIKAVLNNCREERKQERLLYRKLQELEATELAPTTPNRSGMPSSGRDGFAVEDSAIKLMELQAVYDRQKLISDASCAAVERMITGLPRREQRVIRYRYIEALTWDQVCYMTNYSWSHTDRIHKKALSMILEHEREIYKKMG